MPIKLFRDLPEDLIHEFEANIRILNANSVRIIAGICLFFLFFTLGLDLLRYRSGLFEQYTIYPLLFANHLLFALQVIPLFLLWRNWKAINNRSYPHTKKIISFSIVSASFTLLIMTTLTVIERGSVLLYAIYILLINFLVILPHRWRITFNVISFLFITIAIISIQQNTALKIVVSIIEVIGITIPGFLVSTYRYNDTIRQFLVDRRIKEQNKIIEDERKKSDDLLLNILPANIAQELKENGQVQPKHHESVAILFSDFKGYTQLSKEMSPDALVRELDACFSGFDTIVEAHQLEKIKTLGDGYLCVGGIGEKEEEDAVFRIVSAGQEMIEFMAKRKAELHEKGMPAFDLRIGIHCGPVVAGVVGKSKFTYDLWGSTVNIASRMETAGAIGQINVSEAIHKIIASKIACTPRGEIEAKGIGKTKMFFIAK